jgi:hypothetical protein
MLAWGEVAKRGMKRSSSNMGRYGRDACFPISPLPHGERARERGRVYRTVFAPSRAVLPSDGTPNQSTKPASGQVAGYPQPSHPQGVRRWVPRCFAATLPQPLKGEGAGRAAFVGAPPLCPLGCSGRCFNSLDSGVRRNDGYGVAEDFRGRSGDVAGSGFALPSDGTTNQSTKPASGQVAGYPQPSVAVARFRCSPPPQPSPLKGEGALRS